LPPRLWRCRYALIQRTRDYSVRAIAACGHAGRSRDLFCRSLRVPARSDLHRYHTDYPRRPRLQLVGWRAVSLRPALSKNPTCVRPCTDTSGYKALGFLIVEHFPFNSILAISPQAAFHQHARRRQQAGQLTKRKYQCVTTGISLLPFLLSHLWF
jgi:hypothetical protein